MSSRSVNPIFRDTLIWGSAVAGVLALLGAVIGFAVAGVPGLFSALAGVVIAAVFLGITAASILIADRWFGEPDQIAVFFGIVIGSWLVKLLVFVGVLVVMRLQDWVAPYVFLTALLASVIASLVVDIVVMARARVPYVGNVALPTSAHEPPDDAERA